MENTTAQNSAEGTKEIQETSQEVDTGTIEAPTKQFFIQMVTKNNQAQYITNQEDKEGKPMVTTSIKGDIRLFPSDKHAKKFINKHNLHRNINIFPSEKIPVNIISKAKTIQLSYEELTKNQQLPENIPADTPAYGIIFMPNRQELPKTVDEFLFLSASADPQGGQNGITPKKGMSGCFVWLNETDAHMVAKEYIKHLKEKNINGILMVRNLKNIKTIIDIIKPTPNDTERQIVEIAMNEESERVGTASTEPSGEVSTQPQLRVVRDEEESNPVSENLENISDQPTPQE